MQLADRHIISTLDRPTHFWSYGSPEKPLLVLVHGFRGDHHGLELIARELADRHYVVVPDVPGFGESAPLSSQHTLAALGRWLTDFCHAVVQDNTWYLLGHSFGSLIVSQAIADGLRPTRLTLINPISAPALAGPRGVLTRLAVLYYELGAKLPQALALPLLRNRFIVRVMSSTMAKTRDPELRAWIHDQHDRYFSSFTDRESLLEAFRASVSHTVMQFTHALTMPTLCIVGDRDDITPLEQQLVLNTSLPDGTLRIIKGVGHLVHYEAHEIAAHDVRAFLGGEVA